MKKVRVLSLFDGISCGMIALERAGFEVEAYYASEIDENAIKISTANYPDIIQLGDVTKITKSTIDNMGEIDILIGGSPCQDLSSCRNGEGLSGTKSGLFYEYLRIKELVQPKYFLLENVIPRKRENAFIMSEKIGVQPVEINSADFSAQNRPRLYWTNIPFKMKKEKCKDIVLDILEDKNDFHSEHPKWLDNKWGDKTRLEQLFDCYGKASCLTAAMSKGHKATYTKNSKNEIHKFTPLECERLQTLPENYTACVANTHRYTAIGNGWTVDVIAHILSYARDL